MKALTICCGFLLVLAVSKTARALPADSRTSDGPKLAKLELEKDAEAIPVPELPPYDGFLGGLGDLFERMRQQMLYLMSHVPKFGFATPEGGNTTSVTKVIDGHKITINETVYTAQDGDDPVLGVFKIRVVDVRPDGDQGEASVEHTPDGPKSSVESLEFSRENEIPKSNKVHQQKRKVNIMDAYNNLETFDDNNEIETFDAEDNNGIETFDDVDNNGLETFDEGDNSFENDRKTFDDVDLTDDIRVNKIAEFEGRQPDPNAEYLPGYGPPLRDLSDDIRINDIARNSGRQFNPDAEYFDSPTPLRTVDYDLSRDTYVNEIPNIPMNPDAEFIHPDIRSRYYYRTDNS